MSPLDDRAAVAEMHGLIKRLLANDSDCETRVREILQNRFDAGDLQLESVELVQKMLDQSAPEEILTLLEDAQAAVHGDTEASPGGVAPVTSASPRAYQPGSGPPQVGSLIGGRFLLQKVLQGGSMGTVYQAVDERLADAGDNKGNVAIKVLPPELTANAKAMRALQQEVAKGRCLTHQNIVRFIDLERDGDLHFIVMEQLEGRSLATILESAENQKIELTLAMDIVVRICAALEFAHERGVVHGDVKPANIVITPAGEPKLFDFGVARVRQNERQDAPDSEPAEFGTLAPPYSSMQVLTGEEPVITDDVFSLGCLMYRLVAGYRVFGPRNAAEAAAEGMEPQQPQGLGAVQWQALKKTLAYSRVPRFATVAEFVAALEGMPESAAESATPDETGLVETLSPAPRRVRWRLALSGVLVAAIVAVAMQTDSLDRLLQLLPSNSLNSAAEPSTTGIEPVVESARPARDEASLADTIVSEAPGEPDQSRSGAEPQIDFAALLPPTLTVGLARAGQFLSVVDLTLREGGEAATIDLVRMQNILESYAVQFEEIDDEDEPSAWEAGEYEVSNNGLIVFDPGQSRARTTIAMLSDAFREPDREVIIRIREADGDESELARIRLQLEDDDRREFEASLPQNTIGFATDEISVREDESAVRIDVIRFQPDNEPAEVSFVVRDGTAKAGEDYFPPDVTTINFGRGQRTARIIIPLVHDVERETVESFTLELVGGERPTDPDIFQRIAVMIRDDD